jgi:hypothetical protein
MQYFDYRGAICLNGIWLPIIKSQNMNDKIVYCKEVKKTSLLVEQIKNNFAQWQTEEKDFDEDFFDEETVESYLQYLVGYVHKDDWFVIEDRPDKQKSE